MISEIDLLKVIVHKLANIEKMMVKTTDLDTLIEEIEKNKADSQTLARSLDDLKLTLADKHVENINADEVLLQTLIAKTTNQDDECANITIDPIFINRKLEGKIPAAPLR
ncbi:hypothetical protein [Texcoconibacillus texcoconensis]|uniref:Uncharacterized protein n=1 Tax=Texcoconibacillus texcoconensis TaxID=1095777 RepID=A0A840QPZ9_9BACI|nr:hypothetical protein [Texcoconibacillus texcoconensis]MBB5173418.1 hypothetical protein [Texcoconibacillus texcoconensis]